MCLELACFLDWSGGRPPVETERGGEREREKEGGWGACSWMMTMMMMMLAPTDSIDRAHLA